MRHFYPLKPDDIRQAAERLCAGDDCTIPVREDFELTNGTIFRAILSWGSESYYKVHRIDGALVGAPREGEWRVGTR